MRAQRLPPVAAPDWLTARPVAHRGLHDAAAGLVENSIGAARAAIARGFAIECDVQLTRDGDAVVLHDFDLDRLTAATGPAVARTSTELAATAFRHGGETIPSLTDFLAVVDARVPVVCEIKSRFDADLTLTRRVRDIVAAYRGPIALKSFDPVPIAHLRRDPPCPLGIVAEALYTDDEWSALPAAEKRALAAFLHVGETRPDFVSFHVGDMPHAVPHLCRAALGCPVLAWTVRTPAQRAIAADWADQMIFEGFLP